MPDHINNRHPAYPPGLGFPSVYQDISNTDTLPSVSSFPRLPKIINPRRKNFKTWGITSHKKEPILSCGVICLRNLHNKLCVLLIRRKDSLSYVEFVRGKYKPSDPHYIRELVDGMTKKERNRIVHNEFSQLWRGMWISKSYRRHRPEYDKSLVRFNSVKANIREYIQNNPDKGWEDPEWGFPKGRPNKNETTLKCALREFKEETGIDKDKLYIIGNTEYEEDYIGTNGIFYKHRYVIGTCFEDNVGVDPGNRHQAKEVSDVRWIPLEDASTFIRNTYPSRLMILENVSKWYIDNYSN